MLNNFMLLEGEDVFSKFTTAIKSVYSKILSITTIIAVLAAVIALIMRMYSTNPRTVETATSWLKRILISWVLINSLTYIATFLEGTFDGAYSMDETAPADTNP